MLLDYAAQLPTKLAVVGAPFSQEQYGIGYCKGDRPFCGFLTGVIQELENDGRWDRALRGNPGQGRREPGPDKTRDPNHARHNGDIPIRHRTSTGERRASCIPWAG